jgi:hypothetical protein
MKCTESDSKVHEERSTLSVDWRLIVSRLRKVILAFEVWVFIAIAHEKFLSLGAAYKAEIRGKQLSQEAAKFTRLQRTNDYWVHLTSKVWFMGLGSVS